MTNNHFVKMCRKSKLKMREIRYFRDLQYFDTDEEKYVTYKRVKECRFNATIPVEGTLREKSYFDDEYDFKKDPRKYYVVTFYLHPEETMIVMKLSCGYGEYLIKQSIFKKMCNNENFAFSKEQDEYYESQYELKKKQKEIEERMKLLEKDFENEN